MISLFIVVAPAIAVLILLAIVAAEKRSIRASDGSRTRKGSFRR